MRTEDLTLEHLMRIRVRPVELSDLGAHWFNDADEYLSSEFKKAVLNNDGDVVFVFGGKHMEGDGWVWMLSSNLIYDNPVASAEIILRLHEEAKANYPGIKRYFTLNDPEFPEAIKFLERLGYENRGVRHRTDGKERVLLVKEIG